jgi:hypothetical protein
MELFGDSDPLFKDLQFLLARLKDHNPDQQKEQHEHADQVKGRLHQSAKMMAQGDSSP